jgi:hypothetical protein
MSRTYGMHIGNQVRHSCLRQGFQEIIWPLLANNSGDNGHILVCSFVGIVHNTKFQFDWGCELQMTFSVFSG